MTAEEYFRSDADGTVLLVGRCASCERPHFPRAAACPYCAAREVGPDELGPNGVVRQATVVTAAPPGYDGAVPYGFGVVDVGGELEVITRLTLNDDAVPAPGTPVRCASDRVGSTGQPIWIFESGESVGSTESMRSAD